MQNPNQNVKPRLSVIEVRNSFEASAPVALNSKTLCEEESRKMMEEIAQIPRLSMTDQARAIEVRQGVVVRQSTIAINKMVSSGFAVYLAEHAPTLIEEIGRLSGEIRALAESNTELALKFVVARLRRLGLYEEARLPRMAAESFPVREERGRQFTYQGLSAGGFNTFNDGKGGVYYEGLNAMALVRSYDAHVAALKEVQDRAEVLAEKFDC